MAYVLNGRFPCDAEFWIMSVYLPAGIALFQINNAQLHAVADSQKVFLKNEAVFSTARPMSRMRGWRQYLVNWRSYNQVKRTAILVTLLLVVQVRFSSFVSIKMA